ncbi:MAG: glycosyltransferase family 25 protein [Roseobacter sp.]|jgi:hypothetical protein
MIPSTPVEGLQTVVDGIYVVNLESRPDRRREMVSELERIGLPAEAPLVTFFKAVRPDTADPFPSIGAHGCFLSQLGVLKSAMEKQERAILLLEDDASFTRAYIARAAELMGELETVDWSIAYLGHRIAAHEMPGAAQAVTPHWRALPPEVGVVCAHAVLFRQRAIAPLVAYLERMLERPAGHPDGGPMHVDGAYSWFRRDHPEMITVVTPEQYVVQRASRSDIAPASWKDHLPFLGLLRSLKNRLSGRR